MTQQFKVGDVVKVTAPMGGLFDRCNFGKTGTVTRVDHVRDVVYVEFGTHTDYGRPANLTLVSTKPEKVRAANETTNGWFVGDRVKVNTEDGKRGSFFNRNSGKIGEITGILADGIACEVKFTDGTQDCGYLEGLTFVSRGESGNWIENKGVMPVPRGTLIDVKYKDGLVMLNLGAGSTDTVNATVAGNTGRSKRYARDWTIGQGSGTITHYRLVGGAVAVQEVAPAPVVKQPRLINHHEMQKGMSVRYLGAGKRGHEHWNFVVGNVYRCGDGGPIAASGCQASSNWADWKWELVEEESVVPFAVAARQVREQLDAIKAEKQAAEAEVAAARAKVNEIEARRVALVATVASAGLQFIS